MARSMIDAIKRISLDAVNASVPTDLRYGTVTKVNPIEIRVSSELILPQEVLMIPERMTDHYVVIDDDESKSGDRFVYVHGALNINDKVIMIREQGGQKFLVLDKIAQNPNSYGEEVFE